MMASRSGLGTRVSLKAPLIIVLLLELLSARAADVSFYLVAKGLFYGQASSAAPVPKGSPYRFSALVGFAATNSVTNVTVQPLPGGAVQPLQLQTTGTIGINEQFSLSAKYATNSQLQAAYPDGSYQFVIQTLHDGTKSPKLTLNGDTYPATVPYLSNFNGLQAINPAASFTLSWSAFTGGTASDLILVTIADASGIDRFSTPYPGQPNALNGTATSIVIPPNTLPSGTLLGGIIIFAKIVAKDTTSYSGVPGFAAYYTQTQFTLNTTGTAAATPPTLKVLFTNSVGPVQILLTGQSGSRYAIDASSNLQTGSWLPLVTNTATGGQFLFSDPEFSLSPVRFYRGRAAN